MQMMLEERDLWEVTSGEIKLERLTTALDHSTFKCKSRKALAMICLAIEDSQLPLVRSTSEACDAWSRLEGHFEKESLANKLFLRRRFFTEDDLVITLLGGLSESFAFLITALDSRADSLSWELVTSRLLHEDMKRKEQYSDGVAAGQAFMTGDRKHSGRPFKKTGA
ncbi:unnamed protein product [Peronospora destructor]|uniref:Uncharacterized protein n=1 Tax=Peronospora destructor TaxID=86335 RepID=A0AAV0STT0_9STRA|nr:unnamed protein product [Peronospora destructor]